MRNKFYIINVLNLEYLKKLCIFFRNTDNDPRHSSIIGKFKQCKDQIQKIGVIYNEIKTKPFRIIGV